MRILLAGRNKQTFFPTVSLIRAMVLATTYSSHGTVLPDPYTLVENWKDNVKPLRGITWAGIYKYLINMPSLYTNKNLKGYKFLEVYNFFVSGHVHNVAYHGINNLSEFCFIKTKVIIKGLSLQVKICLDFLRSFPSMLQSYAIPTLVVTYFVFILTYSYTVLDQYGRVSFYVV